MLIIRRRTCCLVSSAGLNDQDLDGRNVRVNLANSKPSGGGGGGFGGGYNAGGGGGYGGARGGYGGGTHTS